jgi:hypothetical protein
MRPIPKIPITKRPGRVAQGEGPEFKSQYQKKKKKKQRGRQRRSWDNIYLPEASPQ